MPVIMAKIYDNKKDLVRLVPRFPASWTKCSISDYPVLIGDKRGTLEYVIERVEGSLKLITKLSDESALDIRMGPIDVDAKVKSVTVNGEKVAFESYLSGDSRWVWIRGLNGNTFDVNVNF